MKNHGGLQILSYKLNAQFMQAIRIDKCYVFSLLVIFACKRIIKISELNEIKVDRNKLFYYINKRIIDR